jgi:cytoskeleton protein RodZ
MAYKILLLLRSIMKNIGLKLKDKREENGLSIEEVAEDLKMRPSQISSIEEGKTEDFKDVFYLKYFIRDYAKYLGLDSERILDEFNEYLFDMTSKIPIELIKEAKKDKNENNDTISPYTKESSKIKVPKIIIGLAVIVILIVVGYFIVSNYKGNDFSDNDITYSIRR